MANDDSSSVRNPNIDADPVATEERDQRRREESRAEIRALIRERLDVELMPRTTADFLVDNPRAMADALIEVEDIQRYTLYALGIVGFFVWILLMSRR